MKNSFTKLFLLMLFALLLPAAGVAQQTAEDYLRLGKDQLEKKDYLRAAESFEKAVGLDPTSAEAYYFRGRVQLDDEKAAADFTKAIELKPDYAEAYFRRGLGRDLGGNERAALEDYNKAIELDPKFVDAYMTRAVLYLLANKGEEAIADYTKVIELKPDGESYYVRGNAYLEIGEYAKAVPDLTESIELDPTYYWSYMQRAKAYRRLKKFALAEADERQAARIGPPR
ncbi:MAG TPA: tetratricopeptide repeat protein [Pyrinomonadaceae bacterium]|nr:tetratricopeptide repeat protein [Pyrinomonadaceae bacterium]